MLVAQSQGISARTIDMGIPSIDESAMSFDQSSFENAMAGLNELDSYVSQNEGVTYSDLKNSGSDLISGISDISAPMGMSGDGELPLGIPAFWWGCILSWVGILIVYLVTDNDRDQVKKAFKGCLIATGVSVVFYVLWWALWAGTASSLR